MLFAGDILSCECVAALKKRKRIDAKHFRQISVRKTAGK